MSEINSVTTLEQAELVLRRAGIVQNEMVEGKQLLEICGFNLQNPKQKLDRQIERHSLTIGEDFTITSGGFSRGQAITLYHFTINAANHILLAAMTPEGKQARQEATDLKLSEPVSLTSNALLNALIQTQIQTDTISGAVI